jgi:hypothetical protein
LLLLVLRWFCASSSAAQSFALPGEPPVLHIPRVSRPPKLEDFLNGVPRESEARVTGFLQREPGDGVPVSQETTAYLSFDSHNLYVVFVCKDLPDKVRAHLAKREDIGSDDSVVLNLDTFHDRRRAYTFSVNPLGVQQDFIFTEGQGADMSFDTLWRSEGRLSPDGFVVWMAIPFKSLRFPPASVQHWGIGLGRNIVRNNEFATWPHVTQRIESYLQQLASLEGLERISPGRNLEFIPYAVFNHARFLDRAASGGPAFCTDTDGRAGLDAKLVLRDALTLDLALNPDFSQVESDEPQVTVNQRFEVFFPEKRPFFIENAGYFQTPVNLFFSRRVADPQFGVRLTGKLGPWSLGGIAIDDRAQGKQLPPTDPARGKRAAIGVARIQREFRHQSTLGLLVTSRDFAASSNRVFSLDSRLKLNPNWVFEAQLMRSYARQLDTSRRSGPAYSLELNHVGRHFQYSAEYLDISPDFRSDLGFVRRVDIRQMEHFAQYYWKPKNRRVLLFGPDVRTLVNWNRQGQVQDWVVDTSFGGDFKGPLGMGCRRLDAFELFQGRGFRRHFTDCGLNASWLKWLELTLDYGSGTNINYFPGAPLLPFLAQGNSATAGFTFRPSPRLRFAQTYLYTRLSAREGSTPAGFAPGTPIFNDHILRSKLNYQFTRELSLRLILDYHASLPNPQLVQLSRDKSLKGDILFTYLLHPGTALYIGYSDLYENVGLDSVSMAPLRTLRQTNSPSTSTGRLFFVKLSYLFRF